MAQTLTAFGTKLVAQAANVATQMGGTTAAEVAAYGNFLINAARFPGEQAGAALRNNDINVVLG